MDTHNEEHFAFEAKTNVTKTKNGENEQKSLNNSVSSKPTI